MTNPVTIDETLEVLRRELHSTETAMAEIECPIERVLYATRRDALVSRICATMEDAERLRGWASE